MQRFVITAVLGSARQALAIFVAVVAIAGGSYFVTHKLSNPDHYRYGGCPVQGVYHGFPISCRPPTRAAWQIPVAIVIAAVGLGAAVKIAGERRWRHARDQYVT